MCVAVRGAGREQTRLVDLRTDMGTQRRDGARSRSPVRERPFRRTLEPARSSANAPATSKSACAPKRVERSSRKPAKCGLFIAGRPPTGGETGRLAAYVP